MKLTIFRLACIVISVVCLLVISNCKKETVLETFDNSRSVEHRIRTLREDINPNMNEYVTSTFYYDSLGRCIQQDVASNTNDITYKWTWTSAQITINVFNNGSLIPDTFYVINLDNNGLITQGNLFMTYDSARFNSQSQMVYRYTDISPPSISHSTVFYWSADGNIDSSATNDDGNGAGIHQYYTYYPGTINTISAVNYGRTYFGARSQNLRSSMTCDNCGSNMTWTYEFDSLNRATMQIMMASAGWTDTIFYTYY